MNERLTPLFVCLIAGACSSNEIVSTPETHTGDSTPIWDVQGDSYASPLDGQAVTITGVVTGDFQDSASQSRLGGFYLQSETTDNNPHTSDGVFVYDGPTPTVDTREGDVVVVTGTVAERFGETQIVADEVTVTGSGSVVPVDVLLPAEKSIQNRDGAGIADFERYEGMLVRFPQSLTVTELYDLERFGEVLLSSDGRLMKFTNSEQPGVQQNAASVEQHLLRSLRLDDGSSRQNVAPIRYLYPHEDSDYSVRAGDRVTYLVGNIRFSRGSGGSGTEAYRLVPMDNPLFVASNPRPTGSPDPGGSLRIASFNVLNFFTRNYDEGSVCGPSGDSRCRGASNAQEFSRQLTKTSSTLAILDADIVGLIELENTADTALQIIVDELNSDAGLNHWSYIDTGDVGDDGIRNGFIYDTTTVTPVGDYAVIDSAIDARFLTSKNRPSIAQTFRHTASGGVVTVVINHFKSKGSSCEDIGDPDNRDGQGNCNQTRAAATAAMVDWLAQDPTGSGDSDFLIIGDLNAYLREDPVTAFEAAGYTNLLRLFGGPDAYSYLFRGEAGALDHALASPSLAPQIKGALEWHINADEPAAFDYNLDFGRDPALFDGSTPYRASDHDPVVVGLELH